jgi:hypothetical protein
VRRAERVFRAFPEPDGRRGVENNGWESPGGKWRDKGGMDGGWRRDINLGVGHDRIRAEDIFM